LLFSDPHHQAFDIRTHTGHPAPHLPCCPIPCFVFLCILRSAQTTPRAFKDYYITGLSSRFLTLGGWLLLPIFDEGLAAVQKHILEAQLKLRYCAIEQVLSFRNHGAFLEPLMAEQNSGHAGHHL
jgi:hypothetical protein